MVEEIYDTGSRLRWSLKLRRFFHPKLPLIRIIDLVTNGLAESNQAFQYRPRLTGQQKKESKMLVLSRQKDESIIIGDDIKITIVDVRGDKVRLGINAPRSISVHREEIYEAIQREKAQQKADENSTENK